MAVEQQGEQFSYLSRQWVRISTPLAHREIESVFDELIHRAWGRAEWRPQVDVVETVDAFVIEVDLPGVEPNRVQVAVEGQHLTIAGERRRGAPSGPERAVLAERPLGRFVRRLEFRARLDAAQVRQSFANGVLRLVVPKSACAGVV
jgi:HSP20 family molecular chaperone IbpA